MLSYCVIEKSIKKANPYKHYKFKNYFDLQCALTILIIGEYNEIKICKN